MLGTEQTLSDKKKQSKPTRFSLSGTVKRLRGEKKSKEKSASKLPKTTEINKDASSDLDPITVDATTSTSNTDTTTQKTKHSADKHHNTDKTESHKKKRHHKTKHHKKKDIAEKEEVESTVAVDTIAEKEDALETTPLAVPYPPVPNAELSDNNPKLEEGEIRNSYEGMPTPTVTPGNSSPNTSSDSVPLPESPRDPSNLQKLSDWSKEKANQGYALAENYIPGFKYSMNNAVKPAANGVYAGTMWSGQKLNQYIAQPALNYVGKPLWNNVGEPAWRRAGQPIWNGLNNYIVNPAWHGIKSGFNWTGAQLAAGFNKLKPKAKAVNAEDVSSTPVIEKEKDNAAVTISETKNWLPSLSTSNKPESVAITAANDTSPQNTPTVTRKPSM